MSSDHLETKVMMSLDDFTTRRKSVLKIYLSHS